MSKCVMTRLGECSYKETGCSDCRIISICEEALEKQIPKKPIYASIDGFTLPVPYYCPVCGEQIAKYDAYARCLFKEHHCKCGQRIDWSEVNRGGQMKATLTIEVPSRGCHHKCPLCVIAHEPISYEVWYQCKVNKLECTAENCPLEIKEVDK